MLGGCLAFVIATGAAAAGVPDAAAESKPVEVQFDGPEGCSGPTAFFASLRSRTDRVRRADGGEPCTIVHVRLYRERGRVIGELRVSDERGGSDTRKVQGASCDDVVSALSLTAALALDPTAVLSAPPAAPPADASAVAASPAPPPTVASQPAAPPLTSKPTPPPSAPPRVPSVELSVGAIGLGVLSGSLSPGIGLAGRTNFGRDGAFRPSLGLAVTYVRNDVLESPQGAQVALLGASAMVCPLRGTANILTVQPCALVLAGWLSATGRQVTHVSTVDRLWLSTGLTVRIAVSLGHGFALDLEGGIHAPLLKRRYFATLPSNVVAETPTISPTVGLGLTYGLWWHEPRRESTKSP